MNTDTKHTPGPWTFDGKTVFAKGQPNVCRIENGHLIAAAPELLAALQELCADKYLADPINSDRMKNARAAISKAEGKA